LHAERAGSFGVYGGWSERMAPRANWKGYLKVAELTCPVALFTAASTAERIAFHTLNRKTGHRIHRQFVDSQTGKPVEPADQVKGYETAQKEYVIVEPDEIAAAIPESDKTLAVQAFVSCDALDDLYFGRPYYLAPSAAIGDQTFAVLREGMRARKVVAIARTVLFRRMRTLLLRADDKGMIATTLSFDYEVRPASEAFDEAPEMKLPKEMLDLARHIIKTKKGKFDPKAFDDRYEAALAEVVRAKLEGRPVKARPRVESTKVVDLMEALRQSAASRPGKSPATGAKAPTRKAAKPKAKAKTKSAPTRRAG
jgi:DNA end-binding protein Ku